MQRDSYYDILFEPVDIGPVTAKNRFYQVPHCTGMGHMLPQTLAEMRGTKAEGGWGVVNTEYCSVHPTSDDSPYLCARLWDSGDVKAHALMVEKVHQHGALAGVQLWHGGDSVMNLYTREIPIGIESRPIWYTDPVQSRAADKKDIRNLRKWQVDAAKRAKEAGFDIIYIYATHYYLISQFLSSEYNHRSDEYGGTIENRARILIELIEETKAAVGDKCAVAIRFCADDGSYVDGLVNNEEQRDLLAILAELPDLWDMTVKDFTYEMGTSRFVKEGSLKDYVSYVRSMTTKPIVSVGRFTSPDTMVAQIKDGIVDMIGAARPSIADPFLPNKVREGRLDEIRECIGCNICFSCDSRSIPIRCTQNPTMGEEWRRGWHPEKVNQKKTDEEVLIIGAGPAGLEAARVLGKRGYQVKLADKNMEPGGRVVLESKLPGLSEWIRVRDYRMAVISKMMNVEIYLDSMMEIQDILDANFSHIVFATGSHWRKDGFGRYSTEPLSTLGPKEHIFSPDDIMENRYPEGSVLIFDDDHYYMGSVIAEKLCAEGNTVTLVTPESVVSSWTQRTAEHRRIQKRLLDIGVNIIASKALKAFDGDSATVECKYTEQEEIVKADNLVMVTSRISDDELYQAFQSRLDDVSTAGIQSLIRIGDCLAPGTIANAVYTGHKFARQLGEPDPGEVPFKIERVIF